jgi:hypothetical protein
MTIMVRIHAAVREHGISDADIRHAVSHAMTIDDLEGWTYLYLGPGRNGNLLEVVTVMRGKRSEMVIHAMKIRPKYQRRLLGG